MSKQLAQNQRYSASLFGYTFTQGCLDMPAFTAPRVMFTFADTSRLRLTIQVHTRTIVLGLAGLQLIFSLGQRDDSINIAFLSMRQASRIHTNPTMLAHSSREIVDSLLSFWYDTIEIPTQTSVFDNVLPITRPIRFHV